MSLIRPAAFLVLAFGAWAIFVNGIHWLTGPQLSTGIACGVVIDIVDNAILHARGLRF